MAEARHGMCELMRHGMGEAQAQHGMCELAFPDPVKVFKLLESLSQSGRD
jgi:hypothetical protein